MTDWQPRIEQFLEGTPHAVVGASHDRRKYGNKVLRAYLQDKRKVYAVNPRVDAVEGIPTFAQLADLPEAIYGISIVTPPAVTQEVIEQAIELGIGNIWMQPGAESESAIARAEAVGANVIAGGPCLLVALRFRE